MQLQKWRNYENFFLKNMGKPKQGAFWNEKRQQLKRTLL